MRDLIGVNLVKGIGVGIDVETPNLQKDIDTNMLDLVAKMQSAVQFEHYKSIPLSAFSNLSNAHTNVTNNNNNGVTLNIEKFENNQDNDIETLANELAFYISRTNRVG